MMTPEEFKQEVERIRPQLITTARRYLDDIQEAEDTVQDVLLRLWQMVDTLRLPLDSLAKILTRNLCIDKIRRRKPTVRIEQIDDKDEEPYSHELLEHTMQMVESLPDIQQTLIRLRHMEGMTMEEIAQLTGTSNEAVRKALSRARKALAKKVMETYKKNRYE
jgi:RNA polymerase sigma-70 factor (ECF subfamily)